MPFRQGGQNIVLLGNKGSPAVYAGLMGGSCSVCKQKQGQRLIFLSNQFDDRQSWARPCNSLNIKSLREVRKGRQHAFHERAMPAVKTLSWVGWIFEARAKYKEPIPVHRTYPFHINLAD